MKIEVHAPTSQLCWLVSKVIALEAMQSHASVYVRTNDHDNMASVISSTAWTLNMATMDKQLEKLERIDLDIDLVRAWKKFSK